MKIKTSLAVVALLSISFFSKAQTSKIIAMESRIQQIEDRIQLKNLVDTFSVLADVKDIPKQVLLFTENAIVKSVNNGQPGNTFTGRKQIGDAFSSFLSLFDVVYHINGQQTLNISGDKALGISYCTVTLIGNENGKKMKTLLGVIYHDNYVREDGHWLIAIRESNFTWTEKTEMK